jgi:hypothetical protein
VPVVLETPDVRDVFLPPAKRQGSSGHIPAAVFD